jgi:hypothetical protein
VSTEASKRLRTAIVVLFWPIILTICYYLNILDEIYVDQEYKNWALAHFLLHCVPTYLYLTTGESKKGSFPFMQLLSIFNVIEFGLPVFFIQLDDYQLGPLEVAALEQSFYAYLIFYVTYYVFWFSNIRLKPIDFVPEGVNIRVLKYSGYILLGTYLAGNLVKPIYHIGFVGFYIYIGLFIYLWKQRRLVTYEKIIFTVILLYDFIQRALDGLIAPFALLISFISICVLLSKSSKIIIAVSLVIFIWFYSIFSVVKFDYRYAVWYGNQGKTLVDKIALIVDLYKEKQLDKATPYVNEYKGKDHFLWRFSYPLSALSLVLNETPRRVPYWNGETYVPLFSKFIPRFMWPGKPEEEMGYKFGTTYRVMSTWNRSTSFNTPILAELYMNFGFSGMYIGCFIFGVLFFVFSKLYNSNRVNYSSRIVGMAIIFPLITWESNFSLTYGNVFLITLVMIFLYRVLPKFIK